MAESSDKNERDDDEQVDGDEDETEESEGDEAPSKSASKASAKDDEGEDDEEEEDDEEDEAPAAAASAKSKKSSSSRRPRKVTKPQKKGSLATSMVLFVIVVGGLATGFAILGKEQGGTGPAAPKWKTGDIIDVELTLVSTDKGDLGCASPADIAGHHCAFETQTKAWSKTQDKDNSTLLQPYTTTDRVQFLVSGLWNQPALSGTLPAQRFSVKCKYKVIGKIPKPAIRWASDGPWYAQTSDWYAGTPEGCSILP